ncbi:uncharacterized protein LOC135161205 isoform X1 [Diachasmimorpha longicaudata]|uniref:uncharacterized protein LOC135161205 isoform X1 n=1 Tax=Diachasmimorpha longicaudata TaxID=58733 RepID=UPI0030B8B3C8
MSILSINQNSSSSASTTICWRLKFQSISFRLIPIGRSIACFDLARFNITFHLPVSGKTRRRQTDDIATGRVPLTVSIIQSFLRWNKTTKRISLWLWIRGAEPEERCKYIIALCNYTSKRCCLICVRA